jgi:hypothetical protein
VGVENALCAGDDTTVLPIGTPWVATSNRPSATRHPK